MEPVTTRDFVEPAFTPKQGQYLAFIYYYIKLSRVAPAEADFARYFQVSAPAVHQMIKKLHALMGGFRGYPDRRGPYGCACHGSGFQSWNREKSRKRTRSDEQLKCGGKPPSRLLSPMFSVRRLSDRNFRTRNALT